MNGGEPKSALGALGLVLVLVGGFALLPRVFGKREPANVGHDAPDFTAPLVANGQGVEDGKELHLSGLRGHAVLLDFWATWCEPCRIEAPIVDAVSRRWRDQGVVVVGVNADRRDEGDPRAFALANGLTYPIAHDESGEAQRAFNVAALPTLVVISRTGKVIAMRTGITSSDELEKLVRKAL